MNAYLLLALLGLGSAAAYALLASGLVLIYRASGVLNFSQGAFAMVGAYLFYEFRVKGGWPFVFAAMLAIVITAAVGGAVYLLLIRPLRDASMVVRVIATLGVLVVLQAAATLRYHGNIVFVPQSLPKTPVDLGGMKFPQDRLWVMLIAVVVIVVLHVFSRRTRFGLTTQAVAENERASAAFGWSPSTIALINWMLGTGLAAFAGILIVPISSLSVAPLTLLVIPALGVALFGGFSSFPLTLLGAVLVGVVQGVLTKYQTDIPGLSSLVPLVLIIVVLVIRRRAIPGRGELLHRLPTLGTGRYRVRKLAVYFAVGVAACLFLPQEWVVALGVSVVAGMVVLSVIVVTGYAGQLSLGQFALAGVGALVAAQVYVNLHWPFPVAIVLGVVGAAAMGFLFGIPSLRSRGAALAIVTMSLGATLTAMVFNNGEIAGGVLGFQVHGLSFFGLALDPIGRPRVYAIFSLCFFAVAVWCVSNLRRSEVGRRLVAIRANERAAAALGINVGAAKLFAFSVSAALAGLGGVLLAFGSTSILLTQGFDALPSISAVSQAVVGGVGYVGGAVIGGQMVAGGLPGGVIADYIGGSEGPHWLALVGGILVLLTIRFNPNGIAGSKSHDRTRSRKAAPAGSAKARAEFDPETLLDHSSSLTPAKPSSLELRGLSVSFGGVHALRDVDLTLRTGEIVSLIGPNGAGKTTLIDAVTGYVNSSGQILIDGDLRIDEQRPFERARSGITRGFQSLELFDDISVEENLRAASDSTGSMAYFRAALPPRSRPMSPAATMAVKLFDLAEDLKRTPLELSFGRRKLVAIARSVAAAPKFLLLDEPGAGLSEADMAELGTLIRRLATEWNLGILLIEHDVNLVMSISDRVAVLNFGEKIAEGPPAEIQGDPRVVAAYLGGGATDSTEREPSVATVTCSADRIRQAAAQDRPVVLEADMLCAGYDGVPVLRDIDLKVHAGEVVALLGANGAGKTTTILTLAGVLRPISGAVGMSGDRLPRPLHHRARRGLAYLAEQRSVFMTLSVADNIRVAQADEEVVFDLFPELKPLAKRRTGLLSGGEQQMLALGGVLAREPSVVLADELSLGLAPLVVERLLRAVRAAADAGAGVLLVEQHVSKALQYADYVYVLRRGRVVLEGTAQEMRGRTGELAAAYMTAQVEVLPGDARSVQVDGLHRGEVPTDEIVGVARQLVAVLPEVAPDPEHPAQVRSHHRGGE